MIRTETKTAKPCTCSAYPFPHRRVSKLCAERRNRGCGCPSIIGKDGKDFGLDCKRGSDCPHEH